MSASALCSEDWGRLLADHFFRPEYGGTYVLFYVDRPLLAELSGLDEEAATKSLVAAIMPQLRRREPSELFGPLLSETVKWKIAGGEGPPPCLAALALAVLAASEMRREGKRAQNNYHAWFHDLIALSMPGIDRELLWRAYADVYPALWRNLEWWLEELHGGRLGKSTIAEDEHNTKYGFADSQTIFLSSDREKLSQFLGWIRLRPEEEMPAEELLQYFRIWAGRRGDLSPGARWMIGEERLEQVQLGQLIAEAAARWEGGVRDDQGRLEARLSLTLTRPPRSRLGLAAPCPPGFPRRLEISYGEEIIALESEHHDWAIASDEQHWYGELPVSIDEGTLRGGLRLEAEGRMLRLAPHSLYILHMSRELGYWTSVEQIRPGEQAWILAADEKLDEICDLLRRRARPGWSMVRGEGVVPPGWGLIREVVIDPVEGGESSDLSRLLPRRSNRFALSGGLPLPRGSHLYLTEGDPDVELPPLEEDQVALTIELDGAPVSLAPGSSVVSLAPLAPPEGNHVVHIGPVDKRYATVRSLRNVSPPVETPVGHELRLAAGQLRPASLDAASGAQAPSDGARVCGSLVELGEAWPLAAGPSPLILPRAAQRRVLLSEQPGVLEEVSVPEEPLWMRRVGLECQHFEYQPEVDAQWLVTEWRMGGPRVRRLEGSSGMQGPAGEKEPQVATWAAVVLACAPELVEPAYREAWERLRELAGSTA